MRKPAFRRSVLSVVASMSLLLSACGGGDDPIVQGGPLFTTAPAQMSISPGSSSEFRINGGAFPYTGTSGNTNVARVDVSSGKMIVTGVSPGTTTLAVTDAAGQRQTINVVVQGEGASQGGPLFTTAPSNVTIDQGSTAEFKISGGTQPYTVASGNSTVVRASFNGTVATLTGLSAGTAEVAITDNAGGKQIITVSVPQVGTGARLSLAPAALTVSNCTTRLPFIFSGGTGPYRILTSDNFNVPVSSALRLDNQRWYFYADIRYPNSTTGIPVDHDAVVTVLDTESRVATATIAVGGSLIACPTNPLFVISPEAADLRVSEILAFNLTGGAGTIKEVSIGESRSPDGSPIDPVVSVLSSSGSEVKVRALRAGTALMTVVSTDEQRASVVIRVQPQP